MRTGSRFLLLLGVLLLMGIITPAPAVAQGEITMSGSFEDQKFDMTQDSSVSGPGIYVTVFNRGNEDCRITMRPVVQYNSGSDQGGNTIWLLSPPDVTINLTSDNLTCDNFTLQAGSQREIKVGVTVGLAALGQYQLQVNARPWEVSGGVPIGDEVGQSTTLQVRSQAATVVVDTVSPGGQPVTTEISLFKVVDIDEYEYAYSNDGHLEAKVSPGDFLIKAYVYEGEKPTEQRFNVAVGEEKMVTLAVNPIFFREFKPLLAANAQTGEFSRVEIAYTVANVYQTVASAEVRMVVTFNGTQLEEVPLLDLDVLGKGDISAQSLYWAGGRWHDGTYGFRLYLYVEGQPYTWTEEETLDVGGVAKGWLWIVWVILGLLGAGGLGVLGFFLRKRRKRGEGLTKAEKDGSKEERPVRKEGAIEEPAHLTAVSSLRARMAGLVRDQDEGAEADKESDFATKDKPAEKGLEFDKKGHRDQLGKAAQDQSTAARVQKPPASEKPGIVSQVGATDRQQPLKLAGTVKAARGQAPVPTGADSEVKAKSSRQASSFAESGRLRLETRQRAGGAEETAGEVGKPDAVEHTGGVAAQKPTATEEPRAEGDDASENKESEDHKPDWIDLSRSTPSSVEGR